MGGHHFCLQTSEYLDPQPYTYENRLKLCVLLNYYTDNLLSTIVRKHFKTSDMVLITVGRPTSVF